MSPHQEPPPEQPEVYVGGWSVVRYAQVVKWPAVVTVVLNIIVTTARWDLALTWFFLIALTVFLGVVTARVYAGTVGNAAGLGLTAGLIVGVATSLFQFLWFHNLAAFFQIVTTSFLSVLVGVLMSTSAFLVLAKEHRPSIRHQPRHKKEKS
jgi:hypothetical protein